MTSLPDGTITFLFTDIEGSTQRWEQEPAAMATVLARHDALLRREIESAGGFVFKTVGDAFCAAFSTPSAAVLSSVRIQQALQSASWGEQGELKVRMAIHSGNPELRDGDYFGPPLNRVARLLSAAHGSQVLVSQATTDLVRDELPPNVLLRDLGLHPLRDLSQPERVSQIIAPDLREAFPPLRVGRLQINNLPTPRTRFVPREAEMSQLQLMVRQDRVPLVTLTGPGGTGKSRLAIEAGRALIDEMEHGVCHVALASISDPALVPSAIGAAIGIPEIPQARPLDAVLAFLEHKQMLLILDNFEQVLGAAEYVAEIIQAASDVKVIVTSRSPLRLVGERELPIPTLSVPDSRAGHLPASAAEIPALSLFRDRAMAVRPDFELTDENIADVAEICRRLDGLPLAIELAAARIKLLSPAAMLARLDRRLSLLTGGARDLPARQQTLRNAIDWSYELLDEGERRIFRTLAVFAPGYTLEAAEQVCGQLDIEADVLEIVTSLLDKSLIRREEGEDEGRLGMLFTIREFALEHMDEGELRAARAQHAEHYLQWVSTVSSGVGERLDLVTIRALAADHENLQLALEWFRTTGDAQRLARMVISLWWYWYRRSHLSEGRGWIDTALNLLPDDAERKSRAVLYLAKGSLAMLQGDFAVAEQVLAEGRELALEQGEELLAARLLAVHGQVLGFHGNQIQGDDLLQAAEQMQRRIDDAWGLALTLMLRSMRQWALRERDIAERQAFESRRIFQELGDDWGAALSPVVLARIALLDARFAEAREHLEWVRARWIESGDRWALGHVINALGDVARMEHDYERADQHYEESRAIFQDVGNKNGRASVLHNLGYVRLAQDNASEAEALFRESMGLFQSLEDEQGVLECIAGLASVAAARGDGPRAALLFGASEALMDARGLTREGSNSQDYAAGAARARALLSPDDADHAWSAGRAMSLDELTTYALEMRRL